MIVQNYPGKLSGEKDYIKLPRPGEWKGLPKFIQSKR
jgi:hypothetical protein